MRLKALFPVVSFQVRRETGVFRNEGREITAGQIIYKEANIVASLGYQLE